MYAYVLDYEIQKHCFMGLFSLLEPQGLLFQVHLETAAKGVLQWSLAVLVNSWAMEKSSDMYVMDSSLSWWEAGRSVLQHGERLRHAAHQIWEVLPLALIVPCKFLSVIMAEML
jgi:hypothetical protein